MKINKAFLTPNRYSRPQWPMEGHLGLAIHYVGNPGTDAQFNRNYFETCKKRVSAHFVVDSEKILQCMPLSEEAFHLRYPRKDLPYKDDIVFRYGKIPSKNLIGIEMCHPGSTGRFEGSTLQLAQELCYELCSEYGIDPLKDIVRHFDVTGKCCPKWFVNHPDEFLEFQLGVKEYIIKNRIFEHQRKEWL